MTAEDMVKELCRRHNDSAEDLAGWALGYIGSLERQIDNARTTLGAERMEMTLIENLRDAVANKDT